MSRATKYRVRVEHYIAHRKCFITSAQNLQTFFLWFGLTARPGCVAAALAGDPDEKTKDARQALFMRVSTGFILYLRLPAGRKRLNPSAATCSKNSRQGLSKGR
jgi:hypothetical protein